MYSIGYNSNLNFFFSDATTEVPSLLSRILETSTQNDINNLHLQSLLSSSVRPIMQQSFLYVLIVVLFYHTYR